jgi:dihydroorotate dehydrogenase (NAD+) catalytic subunit
MAGATAVGVGSAIYYGGITAFKKLQDEVSSFMDQEGYTNLSEIRGIAHNF